MPTTHKVKQGECLASIAYQYGLLISTIWDDSANADLRSRRTSPYVLFEGDELVIPDKRPKTVRRATGQAHRFRRRGVPERFRLQLLAYGEPRAALDYTLEIGGQIFEGRTDEQGRLEHPIPPDARTGRLILGENESYDIHLGHVDPVTEEQGVRTRLFNLAFLADHDAAEDAYREALRVFQAGSGLRASGEMNPETEEALLKAHGS
jgi:N-acetylmuramoyl-L-alanine amidase